MNRNALYFLVGALVVATAGLGYYCYQDKQKSPGVEISIGKQGVSIEKK